MARHLIWFRADLRTIDNTALHSACLDPQAEVIALFFISTEQWQQHQMAGCRVDFDLRTLTVLSQTLATLNIPLIICHSPHFNSQIDDLSDFCKQHHIEAVYYNFQYEINERKRDLAVKEKLSQAGIHCFGYHDQCIVAPSTLLTGEGKYYSVYTPFKKSWLQAVQRQAVVVYPAPQKRISCPLTSSVVPNVLSEFSSHLSPAFAQQEWPAGEEVALTRLHDFCRHHIRRYQQERDFPALNHTSRLSPYLANGSLSLRQCYQAATLEAADYGASKDIDHWISELIWRDFYKHIMVGFSRVCKHLPFRLETRQLKWRHDEADFQRWCDGKTGFPLVDAAMRQLNTTGWMHNRLRMVTAMFLTKDLFIDWRWGERYFMERLIDGDLSANNGGWQWSASTGNDAAPYFRIFNPARQSEKFDPQGTFIRQFVPELAHLDDKQIHEPHAKQFQVGLNYPTPMVNHKTASAETIQHFQSLKQIDGG